MISFNLVCSKGHDFGGWFASSSAFDAQVEARQVACPTCGDTKVSKSIMAPAVAGKSAAKEERAARAAKAAKLRKMLTELRQHVEENFDDVGDKFPEEARRIFYGETAARDIYGNATDEEAGEMVEEGLPVGRLPWLKRPSS